MERWVNRARKRGRSQQRRSYRAGRRGVSEVIATILILALTVVLFGTIFAFVSTFPSPPAQSVDEFETSLSFAVSKTGGVYCGATLLKSGTAGQICGVTVLLTSGPVVLSNDKVYLTSQNLESNWQFKATTGILAAWGIGNKSSGWLSGLPWVTTFSPTIATPDNITVTIVSSTTLLYKIQVSGGSPTEPPVLTSAYTVPTNPSVKHAIQIFAVVTGSTAGLTVNVSLAEVPGLSGLGTAGVVSMTYNSTAGAYYYQVTAGKTTTNGTYYGFVRGTSSTSGATISGSVTIKIGGNLGGSTTKPYSVTVGVAPQQPPTPQLATTPPSIYLTATITFNNVSKTAIPLWVNFTVTQTPLGAAKSLAAVSVLGQTSGLTISGKGQLIVYSQSPYSAWLLDATVTVTATLKLGAKAGSATATLSLATPDLITGELRPTTTGFTSTTTIAPADIQKAGWSHSCTSSTCPFLYVEMYDNFTKALGFSPGVSLYFHGAVYVNGTGGSCTAATCTTTYTVGNSSSTSVTPGSFNTLNVVTAGSSSATRMTAASWWASGIQLTITERFLVYWGSTLIAYIDAVSPYPNSALT